MQLNNAGFNSSSSGTNWQVIQQLDQDIAHYFKAAHATIQRRNGLLPISKLPIELLCTIFRFVRGDIVAVVPCDHNHLNEIRAKMQWANVSQVCQRWRDIALNEPTLWTMPPLCCPKWTTIMLERSRMVSLTIYLNSNAVLKDIAFTILHDMPRISDLTIAEAGPPTLQQYFNILIGVSAPALESIHILAPGYLVRRRPTLVDRSNFVIPPNSLLGTHKLRHLKLSCVDIHWNSHLLSSLTTLELENISRIRRPSIMQVRCMLERMPRLKYLTLFNSLRDIEDHADLKGPPIPLSCLETLDVSATTAQLTLLSKIIAPSENIRLLKTFVMHLDNGFGMQHYVSTMTKSIPPSDIHTIALENATYLPCWKFNVSERDDAEHGITTLTNTALTRLSIMLDSNRSTEAGLDIEQETFRQLYSSINWSHLRVLDLTGLEWSPQTRYVSHRHLVNDMTETFGALPNIHTVVVTGISVRFFISLSEENYDLVRTRESGSFAFKGLRRIVLKKACFFKSRYQDDLKLEDFRECLRNRRDCGLPVESLCLEDCSRLLPVDINSLRDVVAEVEWDGRGIEPGMEVYL